MAAQSAAKEQPDFGWEWQRQQAGRSCVVVAQAGSDSAELESAVAVFASQVEVLEPASVGGQLWRASGSRVLIACGMDAVAAVLPWMPLLQATPGTSTMALFDGSHAEVTAALARFDLWLPARTPATIVAMQMVAQWTLTERQSRLSGPRRVIGNNLIVDLGREEALNGDEQRIPLTPSEFRLLSSMAIQPGRVVDFWQLGASLPGQFRDANDAYNSVKVHVGRLRQKLLRGTGWDGHLVSVRGRGFLFERRAPRPPDDPLEPQPVDHEAESAPPALFL